MRPGGHSLRDICIWAMLLCPYLVYAQPGTATAHTPAPLVVNGVGKGTIPLEDPWQFHTGDDPAWSNPHFDDSNWEQIDISRPWGDQGHWAFAGHAWYRRLIDFKGAPGDEPDLSLFVPIEACSYQVYWNGRLIGGTDRMPTPTMVNQSTAQVFLLGKPERGILAFRVSTTPLDSTTSGDQLGLIAMPRVGNSEMIGNLAAKDHATAIRGKFLEVVQILMYGQLFLLSALVWLRNRNQKLLFWMSAFLLSAALWISLDPVLFPWLLTIPLAAAFYGPTFHSIEDVALWYLLLYLLDLDRYPTLVRWTRILAWSTFFSAIGDDLVFFLPARDTHALTFEILDALATAGFSLPEIFPLILIALAFKQRMDPARRFVAVTAFLSDMYFVVAHTAEQGERFTRWTLYNTLTRPLFTVTGIDVSMPAILSLLLVCAIVYAVYRYSVEQGQRQTALEQEHRNARAVQQVLIPDEIPHVAGFAIESVYKPAGEVGGDFFQILATQNEGVLAVIGDVSGKGMPAAMTVSLLVGTVRTLAHFTQSPATILSAMNQRMLGRSQGGFTTCLVLRADPDGTLTAANAGHIAPYLAGRELPFENGLPLGLDAESTYPESIFHLAPEAQLTLLTDGVVEARNQSGALFGFERTAAVSKDSAAKIAKTAELFGQDDDITVLTLTRLAVGEESKVRSTAPILSPA
jgi:hypothetical protein